MKPEDISVRKSSIDLSKVDMSYDKIIAAGDTESNDTTVIRETKVETKTWKKLLRESMNLPFISGITAMVISSIPYVGEYLARTDSIGHNLLISNIR